MRDSIIVVEGLAKAYRGVPAVAGVSFQVRRGEIFGLFGDHDAGTTTLVECLQGLRSPDAGTVRVLDLDPVSQRSELCRRIGAHLQGTALPDRIRVGEALRLFTSLQGRRVDWRDLMSRWGLAELERMFFDQLTDQEGLRLMLALAVVNRPELVFLDDVTAGLDARAHRQAPELVRHIRDDGATVVLTTRDVAQAEELCDRVAIVEAGRLVAIGSPPTGAFDPADGCVLVGSPSAGAAVVLRSSHGADTR